MKQKITEEMGLHKEWMKEAKDITLDKLPEFLRHLTDDYEHDYGTICHSLAAGAVATMWAMNSHPQGGITGFQAGCIIWEVINGWGSFGDGPKKMILFKEMLYPQYEREFKEKAIKSRVWEWLQKEAKRLISEATGNESPKVLAHWKSIAAGNVPFGFKIVPLD